MEEVDEAEDAEEVVDAGWAVMRAGLWAAASAAATAGRMEGMSSGFRLGAGGWGGLVVTWRPGGPIWSAAAGEGGAGLWPSPSGLGWGRGPAMCEVVWVGVRGGEQFAWAAFRGQGEWAWDFWCLWGGRGRATGWVGHAAGRGARLGGCVRVVECGGW